MESVYSLKANIKNFSYVKCLREKLETFSFEDINNLPSKAIININDKMFSLTKWVSPKRTRSYPYARVYDIFDCNTLKTIAVIPLIKDEGFSGEMDYLQWDTVSLMSLLNVYVILSFYDEASSHSTKNNKITQQKFNPIHIKQELEKISSYHQSALHWNLNQLNSENLAFLINAIKESYCKISQSLNCEMHDVKNIDNFAKKITHSRDAFIQFSRSKAKLAQNREFYTKQPKEFLGIGEKSKIVIENYLGGQYFFTVDEVLLINDTLYLCESKHSKTSLLPSGEDIKDGLLKLMLYVNIDSLVEYKKFVVVLRLTSSLLEDSIKLPSFNLTNFLNQNSFNFREKEILKALNAEAENNHFEIWINYDLP